MASHMHMHQCHASGGAFADAHRSASFIAYKPRIFPRAISSVKQPPACRRSPLGRCEASTNSPHSKPNPITRQDILRVGAALAAAALASALLPRSAAADEDVIVGEPEVFVDDGVSAGELPSVIREPSPNNPGNVEFKSLEDKILAYAFTYPVQAGDRSLSLALSRKPERYSSAAPLTADARQRIVSELVDLKNSITISVSVGPPSGVLKGRSPDEWSPKEVADTVLIDRSTARITSGQRVSLNYVESAATEKRDGSTYWVYEHLSQASPSLRSSEKETYRHAWAVTGYRPGLDGTPYLYTLNLSCPDDLWEQLGPAYRDSVNSFRLMPPTKEYVAPDQQPWRFF